MENASASFPQAGNITMYLALRWLEILGRRLRRENFYCSLMRIYRKPPLRTALA